MTESESKRTWTSSLSSAFSTTMIRKGPNGCLIEKSETSCLSQSLTGDVYNVSGEFIMHALLTVEASSKGLPRLHPGSEGIHNNLLRYCQTCGTPSPVGSHQLCLTCVPRRSPQKGCLNCLNFVLQKKLWAHVQHFNSTALMFVRTLLDRTRISQKFTMIDIDIVILPTAKIRQEVRLVIFSLALSLAVPWRRCLLECPLRFWRCLFCTRWTGNLFKGLAAQGRWRCAIVHDRKTNASSFLFTPYFTFLCLPWPVFSAHTRECLNGLLTSAFFWSKAQWKCAPPVIRDRIDRIPSGFWHMFQPAQRLTLRNLLTSILYLWKGWCLDSWR